MPARPARRCRAPGCTDLALPGSTRCARPSHQPRRLADRRRGSATERGYGAAHRDRFRAGVLARDPVCTCTDPRCDDHGPTCPRLSTVADHHPRTRRQLVAAGLDPDDPAYGRGLCKGCHDRHTARTSPGGWARR